MSEAALQTSAQAPLNSSGSSHSRFRAWGLTLVLSVLYVITYADKLLLGLVARPLQEDLGLTSSQIGLAGSAFFLAYIIGGMATGLLNKWLALRWSLILMSLAWALCMLPMVFAASFAVLLASRFLLGLSEGPGASLIYTAVYTWHPMEKRSLPGAFITSAGSFAKLLIVPGLTLAIVHWGWHTGFLILAGIGVAWCVLWLLTWTEGPYSESKAAAASKGITADDVEAGATPTVPWLRILRTPTFIAATGAVIAMNAVLSVTLTFLPSYFEAGLGYSRVQAGTLFVLPAVGAILALFLVTPVSDFLMSRGYSARALRGVLPGIALLLCGLSLISVPYLGAPGLVVAVVSIGYGFGTVIYPQLSGAISQICPQRQLAGALGVFFALMSLGGVFAPFITGKIVDAAASPAAGYAQAFQVFGFVSIVGAALALLAINPERDALRVLGPQDTPNAAASQ
ncbi:MFS transporter [Rhodococcus sp. NPDC127530]|uniref:MFS transporter n=1 Tax=unclassified Rhodococcus (in: high G+C Gram-positive bacteria) TaxID=192944 RepID=UPI003627339C